MKTETVKLSQVQVNEANPRTITNEKFQKLVNSVLALPKMLELRPIVVDNMMVALGGNMRFRALTAISDLSEDELKSRLFSINDVKKKTEGEQQALLTHWLRWRDSPTAIIIKASELSDAEQREFIIKDNIGYGEWDTDSLTAQWDNEELVDWGIEFPDAENALNARYICDDGQNVAQHIEPESQDLFFSCPPYFDLEKYSDLPNDASNQGSYEDFIKILENAFTGAVSCLKENRFAAICVGDVRDKNTGFYYDFCGDIKRIFKQNGMRLYNEIILVEQTASTALRASRYMDSRKVAKTHQHLLVFFKGDPKKIKKEFPKIEYTEEDLSMTDSGETGSESETE